MWLCLDDHTFIKLESLYVWMASHKSSTEGFCDMLKFDCNSSISQNMNSTYNTSHLR